MEAGSEEFPIKVETSPEPEHSHPPTDETHGTNLKPASLKKQRAMAWFRRLHPEVKIALLMCCVSLTAEYNSTCDENGHYNSQAVEDFWSRVRNHFNGIYQKITLRNWWFVRDCVRETCKFRFALLLGGPSSVLPCPQSQLDVQIDEWNGIVARRYHQRSNPMSDDPGLQQTLINCCLHFKGKLMNSDDDMYAPDIALWSAIVSRFNEIVGGHILDDWESARRVVVSICEPRYRMMQAKRLAIPNNGLEKAIDKWNGLLKRRQLGHALEMAQTVLWPIFQEKIKATTDSERRIEEAIHRTNAAYIPRNLEEQQNLIARLGQICKDSIKADREKIVHQLEATPRSSKSVRYQDLDMRRKRKSREDEGAVIDNECDASNDSDDVGLPSKKQKRAVNKIAASFPNAKYKDKRRKSTHKSSIKQQLLDLGRTVQSIKADLAQ